MCNSIALLLLMRFKLLLPFFASPTTHFWPNTFQLLEKETGSLVLCFMRKNGRQGVSGKRQDSNGQKQKNKWKPVVNLLWGNKHIPTMSDWHLKSYLRKAATNACLLSFDQDRAIETNTTTADLCIRSTSRKLQYVKERVLTGPFWAGYHQILQNSPLTDYQSLWK